MEELSKPSLYASLMGASWARLDPAVRGAHLGQRDHLVAQGSFEVRGGQTRRARVIAALMRLPASGEKVATTLRVRRGAGGRQRWTRHFGKSRPIETVQLRGPAQTMEERFGPVRLRFELAQEGGSLRYVQVGAALGLGPLSCPLPAIFAPRVKGTEAGAGAPGRTVVDVEISTPLVGLLVGYKGWVEVAGEGG